MTAGRGAAMRVVRLICCALAAVGLAASVVVHFSTFAGVDPLDLWPAAWLLHVGIFVVFIPAFGWKKEEGTPHRGSFAQLYPGAPRWMGALTTAFFVYALVNFGLFVIQVSEGQPRQQEDGTYVLGRGGAVVRPITKGEFHYYQGRVARGFSGHWMLFYSLSLMMLVSRLRQPRTDGGVRRP